jgi:DNA-binding NarL/FixJ family response regulator
VKILLADDHALFRAGLTHALQQLADQVEIIEAADCAQTLASVKAHADFSLVLLDLHLPDNHGFTALEAIRRHDPDLTIVVLSASENPVDMNRALKKGARGFIPKVVTPAVMIGALQLVLAGGVYIPPQMVMDSETTGDALKPLPALSPRQLEVLAHAIEGKSYKIIARELGLAEPTVKTHLIAAFRALGVNNRLQAARKAQHLRLRLPPT